MVPLCHSRRIAGKRFRASAFTRLELVVVVFILLVLAGLLVSVPTNRCVLTRQSRELNNAKTIYLVLKIYASDHCGRFPDKAVTGGELTNANEAYRNLVPDYLKEERCFYLSESAWTPNPPDENISANYVLEAGENAFAYVPCLTDTSNPSFPLIAPGFKEGEPGVFASDVKVKGGLRFGNAIIIRVDGSGKVTKAAAGDCKVYGVTTGGSAAHADIFAPAPGWLEPKNKPLNPASK